MLLVPARDAGGQLHTVQFIGADGSKRFLTGGRITGCYYSIGRVRGAVLVVEGYATGASVFEATGHATAVAFNAGNLEPVARAIRAKFPKLHIVICGDNDSATQGNPGLSKATEAARAVGGFLAVPDFGGVTV
jgi:putative DNA primase/helicase